MRTIAVINQKGGVGKTTTVANLGAAIAARGRDICLIDLDPQAHLTLHYGIEPGTPECSIYDVLTAGASLAAATHKAGKHLWVVPSTIDLAAAEVELVGQVGREQILRDQLRGDTKYPYELVMIDCPPSLGLLTLNALAAADEVVIPLQPHFLALQGLGKLLETVSLVQRRINPALRVSGVILCMYESNTRLSGEVLADLSGFFANARGGNTPWSATRIFQSVIRRNIKLAECPSYGKTIFDYEPNSRGAEDYAALAKEFLSPPTAGARQAATGTRENATPEVNSQEARSVSDGANRTAQEAPSVSDGPCSAPDPSPQAQPLPEEPAPPPAQAQGDHEQ